ncbi:hypothetical protein BH10BDE1_BH10BDE1_07540 [soil metagenome]
MALPAGYSIRELSKDEFSRLWDDHAAGIFDDNSQIFRSLSVLDDAEKAKLVSLRTNLGAPYQLRLGVFNGPDFAGWAIGEQESNDTFYMRNSAILPNHRRKGLYSALIKLVVATVTEMGFQKVYSRHNATNNDVIIPKLKAGFFISSLEVSDAFGVLVHLVYFPKEIRRRIQIYRVGDIKPDADIRRLLAIESKT